MIVVVGGIKGGSGKTTIATNLAALRASNGKKVLLVDADEQKSATDWMNQREDFKDYPLSVITPSFLSGKNLSAHLTKMIKDYDDVIIDSGGRDTTSQRSALIIADLYLVPFKPRSLDIWTIGAVRTLVQECSCVNQRLKSFAFVNQADSKGSDNTDAQELLSDCVEISVLKQIIGDRKAFGTAASFGLGVSELKKADEKSKAEMFEVYQFIYNFNT